MDGIRGSCAEARRSCCGRAELRLLAQKVTQHRRRKLQSGAASLACAVYVREPWFASLPREQRASQYASGPRTPQASNRTSRFRLSTLSALLSVAQRLCYLDAASKHAQRRATGPISESNDDIARLHVNTRLTVAVLGHTQQNPLPGPVSLAPCTCLP